MRKNGIDLRPYKLRGECTELRFMTRASEFGFHVTKPWGDSASYDVIVEYKGRFARVQVKSTAYKHLGGDTCQLRGSDHQAYAANSFDFVAVYIIPEDVWYIIPVEPLRGHSYFFFRPWRRSKFSCYKEAWHLLKSPAPEIVDTIHGCVEDVATFPLAPVAPVELASEFQPGL